jgi:hypothetical protein
MKPLILVGQQNLENIPEYVEEPRQRVYYSTAQGGVLHENRVYIRRSKKDDQGII